MRCGAEKRHSHLRDDLACLDITGLTIDSGATHPAYTTKGTLRINVKTKLNMASLNDDS